MPSSTGTARTSDGPGAVLLLVVVFFVAHGALLVAVGVLYHTLLWGLPTAVIVGGIFVASVVGVLRVTWSRNRLSGILGVVTLLGGSPIFLLGVYALTSMLAVEQGVGEGGAMIAVGWMISVAAFVIGVVVVGVGLVGTTLVLLYSVVTDRGPDHREESSEWAQGTGRDRR